MQGDYKYVFSEQRKEGTEIFAFAATFDAFPPRSSPPSFNPANLMEEKLRDIKAEQRLREAFPMLRGEAGTAQ
jgi:arylsulfatase